MNENQTHILGSKIDLRQPDQTDQLFSRWLKSGRLHHLVTLNPEICLYGESREMYRRQILNKADLTTCDGFGLKIGAFLLGTKAPNRLTGRDLVKKLIQQALKEKKSVYLLGGGKGVAQKAAQQLKKQYPDLEIAGAEEGMSKDEFTFENPHLVNRINQSGAAILLVAFGAPKQEQWIHANRDKLRTIRIAVGIGGVFDYLAQTVPSPLRIFRSLGLEWLFRLFTQPKRFNRVFSAVIIFPLTCLKWRLRIVFVYRKNVVAIIRNKENKVLLVSPWWSRAVKWQFPQGGLDKGEKASTGILREMEEELGTSAFDIVHHHKNAYKYTWPKWYQLLRGYKGQDQDLFELRFFGKDKEIDIEKEGELSKWKWVKRDEVLQKLAPSRKDIGKIALDLLD